MGAALWVLLCQFHLVSWIEIYSQCCRLQISAHVTIASELIYVTAFWSLSFDCQGHLRFSYVKNCISDSPLPNLKSLLGFPASRNGHFILSVAQARIREKPFLMPSVLIQTNSSICCLCLQNISRIWSSLFTSADITLALDFIISYLDYFYSLLTGSPLPQLHQLTSLSSQISW